MQVSRSRSPIGRRALTVAGVWTAAVLAVAGVGLVTQAHDQDLAAVFQPGTGLLTLALAMVSFLLKFARWHFLVRRVADRVDLPGSFIIFTVGFALSVTPGRLGELLKLHLFERRTGAPAARSAAVMLVERATDGTGFLVLMLASGLMLMPLGDLAGRIGWGLIVPIAAVALLVPLRRRLVHAMLSWLPADGVAALAAGGRTDAAPGKRTRLLQAARELLRGGELVLQLDRVVAASLLSALARLCDGLVLYSVAVSLGLDIPIPMALFVLASAGMAGGLSMLPGGLGVVEAGMVGLLAAFGVAASAGLVVALATRVFILWIWVAVGLILVGGIQLFGLKGASSHARRTRFDPS